MASTRIFRRNHRSFTITQNKKNQQFKAENFLLDDISGKGLCVLPLADSTEEVINSIYSVFGTKKYQKFIRQYFFPTRFAFKPTAYPGPRKVQIVDKKQKELNISRRLPLLRKKVLLNPVNTNENLVLDYSDIIKLIIPKDVSILSKPSVLEKIENLIPELIYYFLFNEENVNMKHVELEEDEDISEENYSFEYLYDIELNSISTENLGISEESMKDVAIDRVFTKQLQIISRNLNINQTLGISRLGFEKFLLIHRISASDLNLLKKNIISDKIEVRRDIKKNPNLIYDLVIMKLIYKMFLSKINNIRDSNEFINKLNLYNFDIILVDRKYNLSSLICFDECVKVRKWKSDIFLQKMIVLFSFFFKHNNNIDENIAIEEIEEYNKETEKDEDLTLETPDTEDGVMDKVLKLTNDTMKNFNGKIKSPDFNKIKGNNSFLKAMKYGFKEDDEEEKFIFQEKDDEDDKFYSEKEIGIDVESDLDEKELEEITKLMDTSDNDIEENVDLDTRGVPDEYTSKAVNMTYDPFTGKTTHILGEAIPREKLVSSLDSIAFQMEQSIPKNKVKENIKNANMVNEIKIEDKTIAEYCEINPEFTTISKQTKEVEGLIDPTMNDIRIVDFEKSYVKQTYLRDIIAVINSLSGPTISRKHFVTKLSIIDTSNAENTWYTCEFTYKNVNGVTSNCKVMIPKLDDDGCFKFDGDVQYVKKQEVLLPITKVSEDRVKLTTLHSKKPLFRKISKNGSINNIYFKEIIKNYFSEDKSVEIKYGNTFAKNRKTINNLDYLSLCKRYNFISAKKNDVDFNILFDPDYIKENIETLKEYKSIIKDSKIEKIFPKFNYSNLGINEYVPILIDNKNKIIHSININDIEVDFLQYILNFIVENYYFKEKNDVEIKAITKLAKGNLSYSFMDVNKEKVPLIVILSYLIGFKNVLTKINLDYTLEDNIKNIDPSKYSFIEFKDKFFIYKTYPYYISLLINGLLKDIDCKKINFEDLNNYTIFQKYYPMGMRNIDRDYESILDPITMEILKETGKPDNYIDILLYMNRQITNNEYLEFNDMRNQRIRYLEIIPAILYKELHRTYASDCRTNPNKALTIGHYCIYKNLQESKLKVYRSTLSIMREIKEKGTCTMAGTGGSNTSNNAKITLEERSFPKNGAGFFSISSVDSGDVGIPKQLVGNVNVLNTRGIIDPTVFAKKELDYTSTLSLEEAMIPFIKTDDPKRILFASTQSGHKTLVKSDKPFVRTGLEYVIANNANDIFVKKAKHEGKVIKVVKGKHMVVKYSTGEIAIIPIGKLLEKDSQDGKIYITNSLVTRLKVGDTFTEGEVLSYNEDCFNPEGDDMVYSQGVMARVAVMEGYCTEDDSSLLSIDFAKRISTDITYSNEFALSKNDIIKSWSKIGDYIKHAETMIKYEKGLRHNTDTDNAYLDILFGDETNSEFIEDLITSKYDATYSGEIIDMKVLWSVEPIHLSSSLRKFVDEYKASLLEKIEEEEKITGKTSFLRKSLEVTPAKNKILSGVKLPEEGGVVIKFFIKHENTLTKGDKITHHSSLKSIVQDIVEAPITPDGKKIDAIISFISIQARMINSIWITGYLGTVLRGFSENIAKKTLMNMGIEDDEKK